MNGDGRTAPGRRPLDASWSSGVFRPDEARLLPVDVDTGPARADAPRHGAVERVSAPLGDDRPGVGGTSPLGEVWYSEAAGRPVPGGGRRKIVTHDRYTLLQPGAPSVLRRGGRPADLLRGHLRRTRFSGNPEATARYDYNQIMYRLDLADPRCRPRRLSDR